MTTQTEQALRLALEALETIETATSCSYAKNVAVKAITACDKALATPQPTCKPDLQVWVIPGGQFSWEPQDERFWVRMTPATVKEALAAPQGEPAMYAWRFDDGELYEEGSVKPELVQRWCVGYDGDLIPLYTHQAPAPLSDALAYKLETAPQGAPSWADMQREAQEIVEGKLLWKRFIDGTPLSNDIACWMADFAQEYTHPAPAPQDSDTASPVGLPAGEQTGPVGAVSTPSPAPSSAMWGVRNERRQHELSVLKT